MFRILQLQPCCFFPIVSGLFSVHIAQANYLSETDDFDFDRKVKKFQPPGLSHTGPAPIPGFSANHENKAVFLSKSCW